eukprot:s731_g27.t1
MTDARSLQSTLTKDAGQPSDKRVRILVAQIKELLGENTYDDDSPAYAEWVDTSQMLADVLTKTGCEREPLLSALHDGVWQLEPSAAAQAKKASIRAARHARKSAIVKDGCEFAKDLLCTADAKGSELVARLLIHDPQQRLSAQEALQMSWLRPKSVRRVERSGNLSHREQSMLRHSLSSYKDLTSFDKAVLLMATQFQKREVIRKSSDIFVSTDTDKSGYLSENEIKGALQAVGLSTAQGLVEDTWRSLDTSEDGKVSHSEWLSATMQPADLETSVKDLFTWLDYDGDGQVSLEEVERFVTPEEASEVLKSAGKDGVMNFQDFTGLIKDIANRRYGQIGAASPSSCESGLASPEAGSSPESVREKGRVRKRAAFARITAEDGTPVGSPAKMWV